MADMTKMIPLILHREIGLRDEERELPAREMYESVAKRGYHCIKGDRGEHTMCGVILTTYQDYCRLRGKARPTAEDLKRLGYDEWHDILKTVFWDPCKGDAIRNQSIAEMLVDWRWVNGTQAVRDAQTVLSCVADGIVGPKTLGALNASDSLSVFTRLKNARLRAYERIVARSPSQKRFYNGCVNRTNSITFRP